MFVMLFNCDQERAIIYLNEVLDQVQNFGEILQLIIVEMIRKVVRIRPAERGRYIKCIFTLLSSHSSAVQFEAAQTLVSLSGKKK
jgi:coatomer subunit beta